ncbi:MAG: hypothetical protein ABEH43_09730 [Flavobacteriales bacterium]
MEEGKPDNPQSAGRADLIIQDLEEKKVYVVEAKHHFSGAEDAAHEKTNSWGKEETKEYYDKVMGQCKGYAEKLNANGTLKAMNKFFCVTIAYDGVGLMVTVLYFII